MFITYKNLVVDCYAGADFAVLWGHEDPQDPICSRSRTGRIIALRAQAYYVPGLPKDLRIISPQGIHTSEGYRVPS